MTSGVYKITNIENGKSYIGLSKNIERRWREEINGYIIKSGGNSAIERAIQKHGVDNFDFEILEEIEDREEMVKAEIFYIKKYNTFGENGYNLTAGGEQPPIRYGDEHHNWKGHARIYTHGPASNNKMVYAVGYMGEKQKTSINIPYLIDYVKYDMGLDIIEIFGKMYNLDNMNDIYDIFGQSPNNCPSIRPKGICAWTDMQKYCLRYKGEKLTESRHISNIIHYAKKKGFEYVFIFDETYSLADVNKLYDIFGMPKLEYTLWNNKYVRYQKQLMFCRGREPNPCKCFQFKYKNKGIKIGLFNEWTSIEIINDIIKEEVME